MPVLIGFACLFIVFLCLSALASLMEGGVRC